MFLLHSRDSQFINENLAPMPLMVVIVSAGISEIGEMFQPEQVRSPQVVAACKVTTVWR